MSIKELRDLTIEELNKKVDDNRAKLFEIRFKKAQHQVENTSEIGLLRNEIAQAKTVIREKQLATAAVASK